MAETLDIKIFKCENGDNQSPDLVDAQAPSTSPSQPSQSSPKTSVKFRFDPKSDEFIIRSHLGRNGNVRVVKHVGGNILMAQRVYPVGGGSSSTRKKIRQELRAMRQDAPDEVLPYYGVHLDFNNNTLSIWMQYMDIGSFKEIVEDLGPLRIDVVGKVAVTILSALNYLYHVHRMLHRDVRPSRILLNSRGEVKLGGVRTVDLKSDIWSFGMTIMELCLGRHYYHDTTDLFSLLHQIVNGPNPQLPKSAAFPDTLHEMMARCLSKDPKSRSRPETLWYCNLFIGAARRTSVDLEAWALGVIDQRMGNPPRRAVAIPTMEDIPKQPDDLAWRQFVRNHPLGEGYATPDTHEDRNAPNPGTPPGPSLPASRSSDRLSLALRTRRTPNPQEKGNSNDRPGIISRESPSFELLKNFDRLAFPRPLAEALRPEDLSLCSHCDELIAKGDDAFRSTSGWEPGAFTAGSSCPLCRLISDCSNPTTSLGDRNQARPKSPKSYPRLEIGKLDEFMHGVMSRAPLEDDSRTDSECAFQLAAAWMHRCLERHDRCNATGDVGPPTLPTRVIDVGRSDASQPPRLCKGEGKKNHYLTLSYRWDQNSVASSKTVKGNLEAHEKGIALDTLPQIMQDAIHITRKLGLRYLWIDALCIIQDSREDWQAEAGDMANTYKRSTVTLAAAADTGNDDASETIFRERSKSHIRPLRCRGGWLDGSAMYIFADRTSTKDGSRPQSVLDTRGWVLQEQLLSPRVLTYSHGEIFWDCVCLNASETFPGGIPAFYDTDLKAVDFRLFKKAILGSGEGNVKPGQLHKLWHSIVEEYSRRKLTLETDKLAALSGLAKEMTNVLRDDFVLGLWKKTLWRDLLWWVKSPATATIPTGFIAPSWSWAAVNGAISHRLRLQASASRVSQATF
ncbi:hypothetical protein NM208_g12518 [Fusarium decemcellulare]|uniref:Uncharacterized protein n=1 Tax=Fusarium decemcellulare TaxID=57161 RepID=A0ACC1RNA4_9HYPO|nr:hypothetical protein NM208_g12518 [Fusarium decemcellulare]